MSLIKTYSIKCARCRIINAVGPMETPRAARKDAQARGWERLAWIYTQTFGGVNNRQVSGAKEDYCPACVPLIKAEYREISARNAESAR
jgi:hypothetical protein